VAVLLSRLVLGEPLAPRQREAAELLATLAVPYGRELPALLSQLPLWQAGDLELLPQRVALLTLHAAKGLEFPLVFIAGCEEGLVPLQLPGRGAGDVARVDVEEERRLLYVGMTRAKSRLVMTWAQQRTLFGSTQQRHPSPFLQGLPSPLLRTTAPAAPRRRAEQLSLL
jgi:superfamily I DNA/RNA helicase